MNMSPRLRKFILTAHITFSVGWLGAVCGFLALAIAGLKNHDAQTQNAAYIAMGVLGWYVIVPFNIGSLFTGLIQSLCTPWGLFRHYWILVKFLLTIGATVLLFLHLQPAHELAEAALNGSITNPNFQALRIRVITEAALALVVLYIAIVLSIYKPWGRTQFGQPNEQRETSPWGRYVLYGIATLILIFIVKHLVSGGLGHH
jgi:hypothetical protein